MKKKTASLNKKVKGTKTVVKKKKTAVKIQPKTKVTKNDLKFFKSLLFNKKEEINEGLKHSLEDTLKKSPRDASGDISGYSLHMADLATDTYDREFSLDIASSERELLYEIDEAIKKIDEGTFGVCEECKCDITKTRLKAIPYTRLCLKCQEEKEKR